MIFRLERDFVDDAAFDLFGNASQIATVDVADDIDLARCIDAFDFAGSEKTGADVLFGSTDSIAL
ncbi:MAG: hypothetical protein ABL921_07040 [Pirellula sp.]